VDFVAVLDQVIALLCQRVRLTYRTLQRQFQLGVPGVISRKFHIPPDLLVGPDAVALPLKL